MSANNEKTRVLFICLGNICRSPMAEAVFIELVRERQLSDKFDIDSAAIIDYHVGKTGPESRATKILESHGVTGFRHKVRQITPGDFSKFDYIFGMDDENMSDLQDVSRRVSKDKCTANVQLLGSYDPKNERIIVDPYYYDGTEMFEKCYVQCRRCCAAFLDSLIK